MSRLRRVLQPGRLNVTGGLYKRESEGLRMVYDRIFANFRGFTDTNLSWILNW